MKLHLRRSTFDSLSSALLPVLMDDGAPRASSSAPECYVIVHNVAKKHNIGTLARSATAFNVAKVRCMCIQSTNKLLSCLKMACGPDMFGGLATLQHLRKPWFSCSCAPRIFCKSRRVLYMASAGQRCGHFNHVITICCCSYDAPASPQDISV